MIILSFLIPPHSTKVLGPIPRPKTGRSGSFLCGKDGSARVYSGSSGFPPTVQNYAVWPSELNSLKESVAVISTLASDLLSKLNNITKCANDAGEGS